MLILKFGGASVKDAKAVKNLKDILDLYPENKIVVISAMGKTTNALEHLHKDFFTKKTNSLSLINNLYNFHKEIIEELFNDNKHRIYNLFENLINDIKQLILSETNIDIEENKFYDKLIPFGELLSTTIISEYLNYSNTNNSFIDIRNCIITDNRYKNANVVWSETVQNIKLTFENKKENTFVTQGFIAKTKYGENSTLGREGSDYSAAILAYSLNSEKVIIWKDVPGLLNADPKWFENTVKLDNISYKEAIELSYYGATIIHPKTIKPLQNKNIPLLIKSFKHPTEQGSIINDITKYDKLIPSYIFKVNQVLISMSPRNLSFIIEDNLSDIFKILSDNNITVNLMQNSAVSFSICVDNDKDKIPKLLENLSGCYKVLFNKNLELATIRHYKEDTINRILNNQRVILEQKTRQTARFVIMPKNKIY